MKKTLLLIPAAALLLVGCGEKEIEEDTNTNPTVSQVTEAAVASLSNMYKSAVKGLSLNVNVSGANCHYVNSYTGNMYSQTKDVEVKNAGFKLKLDVRNLDKSIKDWEAAIVVEDLQGTETVIMNNRTVLSENKTFSDIDFAVYLRNGNLYANLSDPELKTTAKDVIDIMYGVNSEKGAQYKAMVDQYAKNLYLNDAIDVIADLFTSFTTEPKEEYYPEPEPVKSLKAVSRISDLILLPSEIPAEYLLDIKEELPMILTQIMSPNSPLKDAFSFVLKDNLFKKIEVNFSSADLPAETFDGDDVNFTASLTANFGDAGLLTSIDTNEVFDVTIEDNYGDYPVMVDGTGGVAHSSTDITHVTGSIGAKIGISYPTSSIIMPDFSGYEPFVFPEF